MPQRAWSAKRERQYEHIKKSTKERGVGEDKAEEIAARTVNKERARAGRPGRAPGCPGRTSPPDGGAASGPTGRALAVGPGISCTRRPGT
jgi:plasmid stabilization system protein ParE